MNTYYERDPGGTLISERTPAGDFYYYFDGLGSVLGLVDPAGNQRAAYTYDPYGANASATGINGPLPANPWRYASGYQDPTGLYHFGARYYDPTLGRWTQQDSIVELGNPANGNRYIYVGSDPVNFIDPSGRSFLGIDCPFGETDSGGCNGAIRSGSDSGSECGKDIICNRGKKGPGRPRPGGRGGSISPLPPGQGTGPTGPGHPHPDDVPDELPPLEPPPPGYLA